VVYPLDNVGPWEYLFDQPGNGAPCDRSTYSGLATTDLKVAEIHTCLMNYLSSDGVIFDPLIADSPRLAWAPQYWHTVSTTGASWQPVVRYRLVFIGGTYFNCSGVSCGAIFYPDSAPPNTEICDPGGGSNCKVLNLNQLSAWLLPSESVPASVRDAFPGEDTPFLTSLFK